jgi:hypothetical protein
MNEDKNFLSLLICPDLSFIAIAAGKITAFVTNSTLIFTCFYGLSIH